MFHHPVLSSLALVAFVTVSSHSALCPTADNPDPEEGARSAAEPKTAISADEERRRIHLTGLSRTEVEPITWRTECHCRRRDHFATHAKCQFHPNLSVFFRSKMSGHFGSLWGGEPRGLIS